MPRPEGRILVAQNKKARHDYHIGDRVEAGLVLLGTEVKSLRAGRASLVDGFATIDDGEVWLRGVNIPEYKFGTHSHGPLRNRKPATRAPTSEGCVTTSSRSAPSNGDRREATPATYTSPPPSAACLAAWANASKVEDFPERGGPATRTASPPWTIAPAASRRP